MYYHYDGMRNVTELTDRNGDSIEQYRYDAFGGLYTGVTAPYNTYTLAGKSYDPKANLVDMHARWYQAQNGRFTTADPYRGEMLTPYTQNRYAYVGNNPINRWDPLGYWMAGDENLSDDAFERIGELTEQWENAATKEEKDRIHQEADRVREQDRNGGSGGSDDSGSSGGSSGGSGGSSDDDDDDESYERPMRAIDWYNQNKAILAQYNAPQEQAATPIDANMARKLIIINNYLEEKYGFFSETPSDLDVDDTDVSETPWDLGVYDSDIKLVSTQPIFPEGGGGKKDEGTDKDEVISSNKALTKEQMQVNAKYIYEYLTKEGWSKEAISALLGNMQTESTINPGRWQIGMTNDYDHGGFGLVQWTPAKKYFDWAEENKLDPYDIDSQLKRIIYEVENNVQWQSFRNEYEMTFKEFITSTKSPDELANVFLVSYERPRDQPQPKRGEQAISWYDFLK
jgi:RHS repeat-associated protein